MTLHAVENVGDAFTVTKEFLFPFDVRRWIVLAIVAFFVGSGMSLPTMQFDGSSTPGEIPVGDLPTSPENIVPIVVAVVAAILLLGLLFALVGAIMEFVLIESLRTGEVAIRPYWSDRWRQGLRLFGFRIAIGLPVLGLFAGWFALFFLPVLLGTGLPEISVAVFIVGLPILLVVGLLYGLVASFTTVFVVPIMIAEDAGVLAGWRRLWPSIRSEWKEYLAYAVLGFVLTIAAGIVGSVVIGLGAAAMVVPLAIVAVLTHLTISLTSTAGLVILGVLVVLFLAWLAIVWALVQVPILSYLRYYALLVLGGVEPELDLVGDRRPTASE